MNFFSDIREIGKMNLHEIINSFVVREKIAGADGLFVVVI
jgi:hypothetical protein